MDIENERVDAAAARYAALATTFAREDGVTYGRAGSRPAKRGGFGASALTHGGRMFVFLSHGRLVAKLPAARVAALVASGVADPYDPGHGRVMREWVTLRDDADDAIWRTVAHEALTFARK